MPPERWLSTKLVVAPHALEDGRNLQGDVQRRCDVGGAAHRVRPRPRALHRRLGALRPGHRAAQPGALGARVPVRSGDESGCSRARAPGRPGSAASPPRGVASGACRGGAGGSAHPRPGKCRSSAFAARLAEPRAQGRGCAWRCGVGGRAPDGRRVQPALGRARRWEGGRPWSAWGLCRSVLVGQRREPWAEARRPGCARCTRRMRCRRPRTRTPNMPLQLTALRAAAECRVQRIGAQVQVVMVVTTPQLNVSSGSRRRSLT